MVQFNHTAHKKMWNWLIEHPSMNKLNWPEWVNYSMPVCTCFACGVDAKLLTSTTPMIRCLHCPFDVNTEEDCLNGYYDLWDEYKEMYNIGYIDDQLVKEYATLIRDFPLKPKEQLDALGIEVI